MPKYVETLTVTVLANIGYIQQIPPLQLDSEQRQLLQQFHGAFLTISFETRHFSSPAAIESKVWLLLTLYHHLELQIQSFKVTSYSKHVTETGLSIPWDSLDLQLLTIYRSLVTKVPWHL